MMVEETRAPMTAGTAVYLAGVAFSFGIRLGQLPLPDGEAVSIGTFCVMAFLDLVISLSTSWLGAGLALGAP